MTAMRSSEDGLGEKFFSVKLEEIGIVQEFLEGDLVGPGFLSCLPSDTQLVGGQGVFLTHLGREVEGKVIIHKWDMDMVDIDARDVGIVSKRLDEVRLMESRKSARLINTDTDFSRLADFNIVEQRKLLAEKPSRRRLNSMSDFHDQKMKLKCEAERREKRRQRSERGSLKTTSIDVPSGLSSQSRKRRTSESRAEVDSGYGSSYGSGFIRNSGLGQEDNLKECTAAMVLMNLCVSPRDNSWRERAFTNNSNSSPSPGFTSSDASSPTTPRPSPATSLSHLPLDEDEEPTKRSKPNNQIIYECTWRGCHRQEECQEKIEQHVRQHLGLPEPGPDTPRDYEEEFYYTELECQEDKVGDDNMDFISEMINNTTSNTVSQNIDIVQNNSHSKQEFVSILPKLDNEICSMLASSAPSNFNSNDDKISVPHPLGDHIGMVRPSYEAPTTIYVVNSVNQSELMASSLPPTTTLSGKKLVSIVPKPECGENIDASSGLIFRNLPPNKSPVGMKSDKKCRKVYGIDQKDLWCTQCKWKKACGRFS